MRENRIKVKSNFLSLHSGCLISQNVELRPDIVLASICFAHYCFDELNEQYTLFLTLGISKRRRVVLSYKLASNATLLSEFSEVRVAENALQCTYSI